MATTIKPIKSKNKVIITGGFLNLKLVQKQQGKIHINYIKVYDYP